MADGKFRRAGRLPHFGEQESTTVDSHRGLADRHDSQAFGLLHRRYRVLSLVSNLFDSVSHGGELDVNSTLMWSPYAEQFQGVCLALSPAEFDNGMRGGG